MPFFAANISDGYMFGKKPIQDRVASCRSMEFEAIEINNPYGTSPSHLAALLQNEETGESLQVASIDTYNGPIDAPISCYAENDISDFINYNNPAMSENSDSSSLAATTQASLAYLNSDHKLFPREKLDGYASIPGTLFAYNNSLGTTFTYASIINTSCVNVLPGTITGNPIHTNIFNNILNSVSVLYVNNTENEYHDPNCPSCGGKPIVKTHDDFIKINPIYKLLTPAPVENQQLTCCPPYSMVVQFTIPLYLTPSLTTPTVSPTILAIVPITHMQSMQNIVNQISPENIPKSSTALPQAVNCNVLQKHYSYLTKTQHLNNKSYFLMKKLLPSSFVQDNPHNLFDVFHNSFYIHELVEIYQHYYQELYRVLSNGTGNPTSSCTTTPSVNTTVTPSTSITTPLSGGLNEKKTTLWQDFVQMAEDNNNKNRTSGNNLNLTSPTPDLLSPTTQSPNHLNSSDNNNNNNNENDGKTKEKKSSKPKDLKLSQSPFYGLTFPTHSTLIPPTPSSSTTATTTASTPSNQLTQSPLANNPSSTNNDGNIPQQQQTQQAQQQPTTQSTSQSHIGDFPATRFDYFLTPIIFTTLVFSVKLAGRNATRDERLHDQLSLTLSITPNTYLTTLFRLLRVLVFCATDNIGILYDTNVIYSQHGNVVALFERLSPLIRHIRVSNSFPELDNTILFNSIHQLNYTGWVCLDFSMTNTTLPTKKILQPWFPHYLRRRNGSAGVLFMCRGKQGKVYVLLGKETKHGQKTVGPFWGRPDKTDIDIEMTAVRETIEESLGCVVNNPTVLYSALKNKGFYCKCPRINLYLVNIGVLGVKERNDVVARYSWLRHTILSNSQINSPDSLATLRQNQPILQSPLPFHYDGQRDKHFTKSLMEMNDVVWVDLYDMYRHYMLKSHRLLAEYGIVIEPTQGQNSPGTPGTPVDTTAGADDDKKDKKNKKKKEDKDGKKDNKKGKKGDDDDDDDGNNNTSQERETIALQPPHNHEHTITSLINTITQQRGNYNNLPLRRFFIREMLYMWLTDPNWLNLVHKRPFTLHSIERLIQLHQQQTEREKAKQDSKQSDAQQQQQPQQPAESPPKQTNSRVVSPNSNADDDLEHKQWRSAPL